MTITKFLAAVTLGLAFASAQADSAYKCTWHSGDNKATLGNATATFTISDSTIAGTFTGLEGVTAKDDNTKPIAELSFAATIDPKYRPRAPKDPSTSWLKPNPSRYQGDDNLGTILQGWDQKYLVVDSDMRAATPPTVAHIMSGSLYDTAFRSDLWECTQQLQK